MHRDVLDLVERPGPPAMSVDPELVVARGRRRRTRHRLALSCGSVAAVALLAAPLVPLLRPDAPEPVPAGPSSTASATRVTADCLLPGSTPADGTAPMANAANGVRLAGDAWLDSGPVDHPDGVRVQVSSDTCDGLAVAVTHGPRGTAAMTVATTGRPGRPDQAFWTVSTTGGGQDPRGRDIPVHAYAVALLPAGQRVCGLLPGRSGAPFGAALDLEEVSTVPAGDGWTATIATMPSLPQPQGATLRICSGTDTVAESLPAVDALAADGPADGG